MSWGGGYDQKTQLKALVEEFFNENHDPGSGRFISESGVGTKQINHSKDAQKSLSEARDIVGGNTKEGIVIEHVHRRLSLYSAGKIVAKASAISSDLKKKFAAADEWLKTDPTPEKVGLVHKLVQKAKSAISYMTGRDLANFAYLNVAGAVTGLISHFAAGVSFNPGSGSKKLWPPPGWGTL